MKIVLDEGAIMPERAHATDAGLDLKTPSDFVLHGMIQNSAGMIVIDTGVHVEIPEGYEAHVVPRSSTFKNFGIIQANHMGVIDHSYCGDNDQWFMPVLAMRDTEIHVGDRICQFRIMKNQPQIDFELVEHLDGEDRGGFGSTGKQ